MYAERNAERFALSRISLVRGTIADLRGDVHSAYRHVEHGLRLLDELGIHQAVTAQARMLAPLADRCDEPELAAQWRVFVNDRGDGWTHYDGTIMASARNHAGLAARTAGDLDHAADAHRSALEFYASAGIPSGIAFTRSCLGFLAAERGDDTEAAAHHEAALLAASAVDDPAALALALEGRAAGLADPTDRAVLLGGADRWWSAVVAAEPTHRADVAAIAEAARQALGDAAYAAALAEGASLDRRTLIARATSAT